MRGRMELESEPHPLQIESNTESTCSSSSPVAPIHNVSFSILQQNTLYGIHFKPVLD